MRTQTAELTALEDRQVPVQAKLAAAWTSFMFLYVYVDILAFYKPGVVDDILVGVVWECARDRHRIPRPERRRQVHDHGTGPADVGHRYRQRQALPAAPCPATRGRCSATRGRCSAGGLGWRSSQ